MGKNNFSKRECTGALLAIGFIHDKQIRRSPHDKYSVPERHKKDNQSPFIMIPHGRKLRCQQAVLKELKKLGGDELLRIFLDSIK